MLNKSTPPLRKGEKNRALDPDLGESRAVWFKPEADYQREIARIGHVHTPAQTVPGCQRHPPGQSNMARACMYHPPFTRARQRCASKTPGPFCLPWGARSGTIPTLPAVFMSPTAGALAREPDATSFSLRDTTGRKHMARSTLTIVALLALLPCLNAAAQDSTVASLRRIYETSLAKIDEDCRTAQTAALKDYARRVELLVSRSQQAGELETLLAAKAEQARFAETQTLPSAAPEGTPLVIEHLQRDGLTTLNETTSTRCRAVLRLTEQYLNHLENGKKRHTVDGEIQAAWEMKAEIDRVKTSAAYLSARFGLADVEADKQQKPVAPVAPEPDPSAGSYSVTWEGPRSGNFVTVKEGRAGKRIAMQHEGGNRIRGQGIECAGGRTLIEGINAALAEACRQSNALTLDICLETEDVTQSGPARILSFSFDGLSRNFSLCQERDCLVLRLRTPRTGANGSSPETTLNRIEKGRRTEIVVTYRPGEMRVYADGREIPVPHIAGDFSNWTDEHQLLLGNEWKAERKWIGRIHRFSVANTFTPEAPNTRRPPR